MKTIAIVNLKGGVGKTVTAVNVAAILATEYGQRVLLIDADPQANATQSLLPPGEYNTLAGLLTIPDVYYDDLLYHSSIRGVLPADDELRNLDVDLLQGERPNLRAIRDLRDAVAEDDAYDCIVIDCPPALSPACAAAIASLDVFEEDRVMERLQPKIARLAARLDTLRDLPHVGDIRQRGVMTGIEMVRNRDTKDGYDLAQRMGHRVTLEARRRGVIIRPLGDVMVLMPPLSITDDEIDLLVDATGEAIRAVTERGATGGLGGLGEREGVPPLPGVA